MDSTLRSHPSHAVDAMRQALERDGAAIMPATLPAATCVRLRAAIDALQPTHWDEVDADPRGLDGGRRLDRYLCVFNRGPDWLPLLDRPGVIDLAEAELGSDCHVIGMTAWRCHPGYRGDPLHADYVPVTWPQGVLPEVVRIPIFILTVHYYLNDITPQLAPTRVIPGSHRAGRAPRPDERDWQGITATPVLARTGDALVFRSDVWHAGSDNTTADGIRYLLQVHYGRREMAAHYSPFLDWRYHADVIASATPRQRRLLGDHAPGAYD